MSQNKNNQTQQILTASKVGILRAEVQNDRLISTTGVYSEPIANALHQVGVDQVYAKSRIRSPMVRKSYLADPEQMNGQRGKEEFVPVSWEQAYQLIHQQHTRIRQQYGDESIYAGSYGWQSCGVLHKAQSLLHRYMNMAGGYSSCHGDYSTGAVQVVMQHVLGNNEVYQPSTHNTTILKHSDVVVLWGANPINTLKITWNTTDGSGLNFYHQLKQTNKTIIAIDPMRSETIEFFGDKAEWIAPKPMTDTALMMGIAHTLVKNNQQNSAFLASYTSGYEKFEAYLLGQKDGIVKDSHWAEKITDVPAERIEQLAELFSTHRTMLMAGWGMQRQQHGEQPHWMLVTLAAMLGQIGLPGGGFGFSFHMSDAGTPIDSQLRVPSITEHIEQKVKKQIHNRIPVARFVEALENPKKTYQHNGQTYTFPDIKMVWWAGGANFTHHQDTNRLINAWQKPELIVISEIHWTAAAKHADIVLPITTSFERNDMVCDNRKRLIPMQQAIKPQYEARNDFDVFADLADLLMKNGRHIFTEGKTELQWLASLYDKAISQFNDNDKLPSFEQFWQRNDILSVPYSSPQPVHIRYADFRHDPQQYALKTPSGKIEIYSETIAQFNLPDCAPHPTWYEATLWKENDNSGKLCDSLLLISPHSAYRLHSQFNYASLREQYAIADREPALIHPKDAQKYNINTGDLVRCYNARGQILAGAIVTEGIKQGVICVRQGGWPDLDDDGLCKQGGVNVLTNDIPSSRLSNACAANSSLVWIEKYQGKAPEVTAFDPPK